MTNASSRLLNFDDEGSGSGLHGPVKAEAGIVPALLFVPQHKPTATVDTTMKSSIFRSANRAGWLDFGDAVNARLPKTFCPIWDAHAAMLAIALSNEAPAL